MSDQKKCTECGKEKPINDYCWKNEATKLRQSKCSECRRKIKRKHYDNNKEKYVKKARAYEAINQHRIKEFIYKYLKDHPCVDCNESNVVVLQFDHVNGDKEFTISRAISSKNYSIKRVQKEIDKCEVRCANCHTMRHAREKGYWIYKMLQDNRDRDDRYDMT